MNLIHGKLLRTRKGIDRTERAVAVHALESRGYVRVRVEFTRDSDGNHSVIMTKDKQESPHSIRLFIAGGKDIDDKVARANAILRTQTAIQSPSPKG